MFGWLSRFLARKHAESDDIPMKVIVGLGNPGPEYENTRHNVGWWVVDHLADVWRFDGWKTNGDARVANGAVNGTKVRLVKPQTYMNLSGQALRPYLRRPFWAAATDLMVVVDEVQLPVGRYRFRAKGSAGGHNGLKSIEHQLSSQEYPRLRIGVGPEEGEERGAVLTEYVLSDFEAHDADVVRGLLPELAEALAVWTKEGLVPVMNRFSGH